MPRAVFPCLICPSALQHSSFHGLSCVAGLVNHLHAMFSFRRDRLAFITQLLVPLLLVYLSLWVASVTTDTTQQKVLKVSSAQSGSPQSPGAKGLEFSF